MMMMCREFEDRLTDYLDDSLPPRAQRFCAQHALRCPACRELLSAVKTILLECRTCLPPSPSASLEERVLHHTARLAPNTRT